MADKPDAALPVPDTLVSGGGEPALVGPPTMPGAPVLVTLAGAPSAPPGGPRPVPAMPVMPTVIGGPADVASSVPPAMPGAAEMHHPPLEVPGGRYVLGAEIARGGMGRVVDATDTTLDRTVALKEALTHDRDSLRRFDRETRITAQLEHPSIVPVYDAGIAPSGARFYVMRKVSGRPLERLVASAETLNERLALIPHIVDSAQAIAHAHERHIVHRDIKPSNILVGDLGETVVIDWGLAKVIGEPEETHDPHARPRVDLGDVLKTRAGVVYGTPGFMAPELLRGAPVNEGCDVYALGATLYHLLSRRPPHYAKTAEDMMKAAVAAPPTPIREEIEGVPPELADIVDKALAHDPTVRYGNARALAEDLQRFLTGRLVAAHHYSPRERAARFIRKNRGVSAAVAALVVVGAIAMVRIVMERDRADAAARVAILERTVAVRRAEELTLARARDNVDANPTKSVAMLKPLAQRYWREVRAIAAAAHAGGVAWGIHASKHTRSLEMSGDGRRALSAGSDGQIRLHDLAARTDVTLAELHVPVMARFADAGRLVVAWHGPRLAIIDAATGATRELPAAAPIAELEVADATAYWVDDHQALWRLELAGGPGSQPVALPVDEPILGLTPSPDGRWIALTGEHHVYLLDRTRPADPPGELVFGTARAIGWAADSGHMVALVDRGAIDFTMRPEPAVVHRITAADGQLVAHSGRHMYIVGETDVAAITRTDRDMGPPERRPLRGTAVGVAVARGGAVVVAATGGLTVLSDDGDGDHLLPVQGAHIEAVVGKPSSPYVIAQLEDRLLVWNLDDIQPRRLADRPAAGALFAGGRQVIVGGPDDARAQAIDVATGAARPLGEWPGLTAVAAVDGSATAAIVDAEHHVHLIATTAAGPAPQGVPGESSPPTAFELAGFATPDKLVLATAAGEIDLQDLTKHQRVRLITGPAPLLGLAWGRGRHPWVAAGFADGTLWRKNLVTGVEATATRVPRLEPAHLVRSDAVLLVGSDGAAWFVHDRELHAWTAGGALERLAVLPKPIDDLGEAGPDHVLAFAADATIYGVERGPDSQVQVEEAMPSVEATGGAMAPETGLLVVLERGAIVVVDPLVRQRWTLASPDHVAFDRLAIAPRGDRVLACSATGLLVWTIALPASPGDTVRWLDAMTNAVDDPSPVGLGWR